LEDNMTCVIGFTDGENIYMGADSAAVANYSIRRRSDPKVFINGEFIIGYTSSFRMGQLLRFGFSPPKIKECQDIFEYMVTDFVESARERFKSGGYTKISSNEETGGTFLAGFRGRLFTIEGDFQVSEQSGSFAAVGCGEDIALGSMFSTVGAEPEQRIMTALKAAEEYSAGVRGPFNILKLGG